MRILVIDIGTGTQDIVVFDSDQPIENCVQLVMPAPTVIVAEKIRRATRQGRPLALLGETMGGGPCAWAAEEHIRRGLPLYATPEAARTFNDDLDAVRAMGVRVVSPAEAQGLRDVKIITLHDLSLDAITLALRAFDVEQRYDYVLAAAFDHGHAPPEVSDRAFRFAYLAERLAGGRLTDLAFRREAIPPDMTRLRALERSVPAELPLLVMDTAPAAILGALDDPAVRALDDAVIANLGNFHTLGFHLREGRIAGLFEHHTGELTAAQLEGLLERLATGAITNQEVFESQGHGAIVFEPTPGARPAYVAIGPRRRLLAESRLRPLAAAPHGDMMLAGCFGLLRACAAHFPETADSIQAALGG